MTVVTYHQLLLHRRALRVFTPVLPLPIPKDPTLLLFNTEVSYPSLLQKCSQMLATMQRCPRARISALREMYTFRPPVQDRFELQTSREAQQERRNGARDTGPEAAAGWSTTAVAVTIHAIKQAYVIRESAGIAYEDFEP